MNGSNESGNANNQQGPSQNPFVKGYHDWVNRTPFITRHVIQFTCFLYILSLFLSTLMIYLVNIPAYTLLRFHIWTIFTSTLVNDSILSVLFIGLILSQMGGRMETSLGSTSFLFLLINLAIFSNLLFLFLAICLYWVTNNSAMLLVECEGMWLIVMPLIAIDCLFGEETQPMRAFFSPSCMLPAKVYPLVLFALFSLFGGPRLDMISSLIIGYWIGLRPTRLSITDCMILSPERSALWEGDQILNSGMGENSCISCQWLTNKLQPLVTKFLNPLLIKPGYITSTQAQENAAFTVLNSAVALQDRQSSSSSMSNSNRNSQNPSNTRGTIHTINSSSGQGGGSNTLHENRKINSYTGRQGANQSHEDNRFPAGGHTLNQSSSNQRQKGDQVTESDMKAQRIAKLQAMSKNKSYQTTSQSQTEKDKEKKRNEKENNKKFVIDDSLEDEDDEKASLLNV